MTGHSPQGDGHPRFEEALAEVIWLESRGWELAADGRWSHAGNAADAPLTHSQAFALEARRGPAGDEKRSA
jgi:hypothetical protein